jgi:hypothetical protein
MFMLNTVYSDDKGLQTKTKLYQDVGVGHEDSGHADISDVTSFLHRNPVTFTFLSKT